MRPLFLVRFLSPVDRSPRHHSEKFLQNQQSKCINRSPAVPVLPLSFGIGTAADRCAKYGAVFVDLACATTSSSSFRVNSVSLSLGSHSAHSPAYLAPPISSSCDAQQNSSAGALQADTDFWPIFTGARRACRGRSWDRIRVADPWPMVVPIPVIVSYFLMKVDLNCAQSSLCRWSRCRFSPLCCARFGTSPLRLRVALRDANFKTCLCTSTSLLTRLASQMSSTAAPRI